MKTSPESDEIVIPTVVIEDGPRASKRTSFPQRVVRKTRFGQFFICLSHETMVTWLQRTK